MNEDYTERNDLAKTYTEKLAALKALFDQQAQAHNLYPLITWDDVLKQRIHKTDDGVSLQDKVKKITGQQ